MECGQERSHRMVIAGRCREKVLAGLSSLGSSWEKIFEAGFRENDLPRRFLGRFVEDSHETIVAGLFSWRRKVLGKNLTKVFG